MDFGALVWAAGGIVALGGAAAAIHRLLNAYHARKKRDEEIEAQFQKINNRLEAVEKSQSDDSAMKGAMLSVLANILFADCKKHIHAGKISFEEFRVLTKLYKSYEELGGNGYGAELYRLACALDKTRDDAIPMRADEIDFDSVLIGDGVVIPKKMKGGAT